MSIEAVIIILLGQVISTAATIGWLRATINGTKDRVTKCEANDKELFDRHNSCSEDTKTRLTKLEARND